MDLRKKKWTALLCGLLVLLLCACGEDPDDSSPDQTEESQPLVLSVSVPGPLDTLDPFRSTAQGSKSVLYHLYENLMRWDDGGDGWAVLAPGQAESYALETDYAGNATYTFTLREGISWSDGTAVTASDFVSAWQQMADPANGDLPHRYLLASVAGYDEVQETGDVSLLAVSAPDARTFVVTLNGSPAYFLEEVCASAYTIPRGQSALNGTVVNGPYVAAEASASHIVLKRNEKYYSEEPAGPDEIHFYAAGTVEDEYQQLLEGTRDLITALPGEAVQVLADSGLWTPEPVAETYGIMLNTQQAPFDDVRVRQAFHLAVDRQTVIGILGDLTSRPAPGIVPYGVADYSERPTEEATEESADSQEPVLPDPNAVPEPEPEEPAATFWDFRSHSLRLVTAEHAHDYSEDLVLAQDLMAQAGYPGGSGFPQVEYIYIAGPAWEEAAAQAMQKMWKDCLGVSVSIRSVSEEEYLAALVPDQPEEETEGTETEGTETAASETEEEVPAVPPFTMAAKSFTAPYSDAGALLELWHSGVPSNVSGYASDAFDILIDSARAAVSPDARDAYLHDAEAILLDDSPVIPVFCLGGSYQLRDGLSGLYRGPNGVYFLQNIVEEDSPS